MTSLFARVLSALAAATLLVCAGAVGGAQGLYIVCSLVALGGMCEYSRLAFRDGNAPFYLRAIFVLIACSIYLATAFAEAYAMHVCAIGALLFSTMALLTIVRKEDLPRSLSLIGAGLVGLLYCAVFAGMTTRTTTLPRGETWLFGLLGIVFAGDTFAYFAGRAFGKRKLLEAISPMKTVEGSIGGLVGSMLAGAVLQQGFFQEIPLALMVATALTTGVFAQVGDLFESLLKRVANVKDSGTIMPGHGGVLDRIDGVYFAAPVFYALIRFLTAS